MGVLVWSYPGWRRFSRELSGFELRRFFALEAGGRGRCAAADGCCARAARSRASKPSCTMPTIGWLRAGVPCSWCRGRPQADARVGRSPRLLHKRRLTRTAYGRSYRSRERTF